MTSGTHGFQRGVYTYIYACIRQYLLFMYAFRVFASKLLHALILVSYTFVSTCSFMFVFSLCIRATETTRQFNTVDDRNPS